MHDALDYNKWLNCAADIQISLAETTSVTAYHGVLKAIRLTIKPAALAVHASKSPALEGILAQVKFSMDNAHAHMRAFLARMTALPKPSSDKAQNGNVLPKAAVYKIQKCLF